MESSKTATSEVSLDQSQMNLVRHKVVFIGDVSVGKTSIINRFIDNKFNENYDPSVGVDFSSKTLKFKGKSIKLQVWDSAGQEKYKSIIPSYVRGSAIIFLVYDISKKETFLNLPSWISFVKSIESPLMILCGNKLDLGDTMRQVHLADVEKLASQENMLYFEISAKTGENMKKMIFGSISSLPFFQQYKLSNDELLKELEGENCDSARSNNKDSSFLDSSRTGISIKGNEIYLKNSNKCKC
jgi:Ras-related protein Rab-6A